MEEIKTIEDRFKELKAYEEQTGVKSSIQTSVKHKDHDSVIVVAHLYINGELVSVGSQERFYNVRGESALSIAETQSISRCIGFFFRDSVIHTQEELDDVIQKKSIEFTKMLEDGMSNKAVMAYLRNERSPQIKSSLQKILQQHESEKVLATAKKQANGK